MKHPFLIILYMHKKAEPPYLTALGRRVCSSLVPHIHSSRRSLLVLRRVDDPFLDVGREAEESLLDVLVRLGRDFEERNAQLVGECLALLCRHSPLLLPVAFVSNKDLVDAFRCVLFHVGEPGADVCSERC